MCSSRKSSLAAWPDAPTNYEEKNRLTSLFPWAWPAWSLIVAHECVYVRGGELPLSLKQLLAAAGEPMRNPPEILYIFFVEGGKSGEVGR